MSLKINPLVVVAVLVGIVVLVFAFVRGCQNGKKAASLVIDYQGRIDKLAQDSTDLANHLSESGDTIKVLNGLLSLTDNRLLSLNENLDKANDRISILLRKHVPIKPSLDTSITTVPNIYIEECAECFSELSDGRDSVKKYRAERDNQEQIYKSKLSVKDNSINYLEKANKVLTSSYKSLIDSAKKVQDVLKPRGRLYLSWSVLWRPWPIAAGGGLMYQNRRNLIFGLRGYYGPDGTTVETSMNFPLSFKKR